MLYQLSNNAVFTRLTTRAGYGGRVFLSSRKIGHICMFNIVFFSKMVYVNTVECNGGAQ